MIKAFRREWRELWELPEAPWVMVIATLIVAFFAGLAYLNNGF